MTDRPLECSECKKPIVIVYTEIVGATMTRTVMCKDCPAAKRKLAGGEVKTESADVPKEQRLGVCCGNCGTTLESVQTGHPLGCQECYEVFAETILTELKSTNKLYQGIAEAGSSKALHIGRIPGESAQVNVAARLLALNEALNETLNKEDYEQAALLRDQIKALTEEKDGKEKG